MDAGWRVLGASVRGTAHLKRGTPCQDAHAYRLLAGGVALLAVADGAGSASHSDQGARRSVGSAIDSLAAQLTRRHRSDPVDEEKLLVDAFGQACFAIRRLAETMGLPHRRFATTLTCAVATDGYLAVGQIGDGLVVAQAHELFSVNRPQRGEYANETFFLTSDDPLERLEIELIPHPVQALALMTDGLARLATNVSTNTPHPPFFGPLLAFTARSRDPARAESRLATFMASDRVCARTDDDKTLLLAIRDDVHGREPTSGGG